MLVLVYRLVLGSMFTYTGLIADGSVLKECFVYFTRDQLRKQLNCYSHHVDM